MIKRKINGKRSQSEIIVTVLLILITIAGVAIVSTFVIKMIREGLSETDCLKTLGQFEIKISEGVTCYNSVSASKDVHITIQRGQEVFNLTGLSVSIGNVDSSKAFKIKTSGSDAGVKMYDGTTTITLPEPGEKRSYTIASGMIGVKKTIIAPMIGKDILCEQGISESDIPAC